MNFVNYNHLFPDYLRARSDDVMSEGPVSAERMLCKYVVPLPRKLCYCKEIATAVCPEGEATETRRDRCPGWIFTYCDRFHNIMVIG